MSEFLSDVIGWLEQHYKIMAGIAVPIIVAILGIFKFKKLIKKRISVGGDNCGLIAEGNISNALNNTNQTAASGAVQVLGDNNQITLDFNHLDMNSVQCVAEFYVHRMYPQAVKAFGKLRLNALDFLTSFQQQLQHLSSEEIEKFSEADVQIALQNAIKSAARRDSVEVHQVLGRLIADRVQKPKRIIAELAINESIEVAAKLDVNLIKVLAFSFMFSRTKYISLATLQTLVERLSLITNEFENLDISTAKFEYLEAISCGKFLQFVSNNMIHNLAENYPHLFLKKVSSAQVSELSLPSVIQNASFIKIDDDNYQPNLHIGLYLLEDASITLNGVDFDISDDTLKERLKNFFKKSRLSEEEIKQQLVEKIPNFENIIKLWNDKGFAQFSLTAVGIAIGRAYLEQRNFGNYDINVWIN